MTKQERFIRYIRPHNIFDSIAQFNPKYALTRGEFSIKVPSLLQDMEWNQMDQLHRPFVHRTYQENIRIALGRDFAISLTRWGRWPFLITVTDTRVERGVFYSDFVLAGVLFVHNIISLQETNEVVELKHEWIISSHRFLKPLHPVLSRMWYKLDVRLQEEDAAIRSQRYRLRKSGYSFLSDSDSPDFYTCNLLTNNTVYPELPDNASISLDKLPMHTRVNYVVGKIEFLVLRKEDEILIWPAACPHEGGELGKGKLHDDCRLECPWHGLKFISARLTSTAPIAEAYGFHYMLDQEVIHIRCMGKKSITI